MHRPGSDYSNRAGISLATYGVATIAPASPSSDVFSQSTPVKPGSCVVGTMHFPVPGPVKLVDHALSRVARKGALAVIDVRGEVNRKVFDPEPDA